MSNVLSIWYLRMHLLYNYITDDLFQQISEVTSSLVNTVINSNEINHEMMYADYKKSPAS